MLDTRLAGGAYYHVRDVQKQQGCCEGPEASFCVHAGIFLSQHPEREEVYLTRRKGFVKLAIQGGAGEASLYSPGPILAGNDLPIRICACISCNCCSSRLHAAAAFLPCTSQTVSQVVGKII